MIVFDVFTLPSQLAYYTMLLWLKWNVLTIGSGYQHRVDGSLLGGLVVFAQIQTISQTGL